MNRRISLALVGIAAVATTIAIAQPAKDTKDTKATKPAAVQPADQHQLPPGWTAEDMKAMEVAATPGKQHAHLAEALGTWTAKCSMWPAPGAEPMKSESTATITSVMDGKFTKCEWSGEMPGMGPFQGFGLYGFDNAGQKFQSVWIDNMGTGMMIGTGELSSDGKTMTWTYNYNCPIAKKPVVMREIEKITGKDTRTMEMHGADPKTGKEYKMMEMHMTRTGAAPAVKGAR